MYLSAVFTGQVLKELKPGGPLVVVATVATYPNLLNSNLVLRGPNLYVPTFLNPPPTFDAPDAIYEVSSAGAITNFIVGTAPPGLGSDHIWGAGWIIFYSTTL